MNKAFPMIISFANNSGHSQNIAMFYNTRIENLEEPLNIFYSSNGGKLLLMYYKLRDRLFPVKSVQKESWNVFCDSERNDRNQIGMKSRSSFICKLFRR
jgi:hypothetical protein